MKKIIMTLMCILIIVIGILLIIKVSKISNNYDDIDEDVDKYILYNSGVDYASYTFNEIDFDDDMIQIDDKTIYFNDNKLYVGISEIGEIKDLYSNFAIYNDRVLVMFYKDENFNYNVLEYDYETSTYNLYSSIDGYNIYLDDSNFFEDNGYTVNLTLERNDKFYYNGEKIDLCTYKNKKLIVLKSVEIFYDSESRSFYSNEVFDEVTLENYIESYNLCS